VDIDKGISPASEKSGASSRGAGGAGGGDGSTPAADGHRPASPIDFRLDPASGVPMLLITATVWLVRRRAA
jgi:hypothetical protein